MKTVQSILTAGIVLAAAVRSSGSPSISQEPADQSVSVGATVSILVLASGVPPLRYQWRFQGDELAEATNSTLVLTNIQVSQAGGYDVVVSDASGSITSRVATVGVDPTFTKITTGPPVTDLGRTRGGSWGDYDSDGYPDLFVARFNGGRSALYRNHGDGTFTNITNAPFAQSADAWITGAWADLDNDGRPDLVGARYNEPAIIYFNNGDGTFSPLQIAEAHPGNVAVIDYNQDGLLDVLLAGSESWRYPAVSWLYRNNGDRTFIRMTSTEVGPILDFAMGGTATCADYDGDGWVDAFCANAEGTCKLFHNDGTGRFVSVTNVVFDQIYVATGAWGDYDNDGRVDLCAASVGGTTFVYRNLGDGQFERAAIGQTIQDTYFSASWADYDNDGFLDLFLTATEGDQNALYHNNGDGTFTRITTGSIVTDLPANAPGSLAALWFDYDNDGFLDLYTLNNNNTVSATTMNFLYHNNGNSNAWLKVKLIGTASNRDAVGAKVRVQAGYAGQVRWQRRDISGGDAVNGNQLYAHFGLGDATNVETVRIEWTSGIVQELHDVATRQILTVTEPISTILPARLDVSLGADVTLTLNPTSSLPRTCQWRLNGADLAGETNVTLHLTNVQTNQGGAYTALLSDGTNWVTTQPANLRVFDRPLITTQPTNQLARPGTNVTFTVAAYSPAPITYQWQANGSNLAGATQATLTLTNVQLADDGVYTVIVCDTAGSAASAPAHLWMLVNPVILQPPLSQTVVEGGDVTLSAVISGNPAPFLFQWRRASIILTNLVQPERAGFFTLTNVQTNQGGLHRVCITNAASPNVTTVNATFTITVLPDADADGLPDSWETACGINQASAHHGTDDDDGDGLTNGQEYTAGTDPTNALSYLKVEGLRLDAGGEAARLEFLAVSNKTYTVQYRDAVDTGEWSRLADVVAVATNRVVEVTDGLGPTDGTRFYRLVTPRVR